MFQAMLERILDIHLILSFDSFNMDTIFKDEIALMAL
jgi:hypothetical protein